MKQPKIQEALAAYPRALFLPPSGADRAGVNSPISIGHGQTNSQPTTVSQMLEWLDVKPGAQILDLGSGSGWTSALLSYLAGQNGRVIAIERIPQLVKFGRDNCRRAKAHNISFHKAKKHFGWPELAPYDNILVSASASEFPEELLDQLKSPGTLVIPVGNTIYVIKKNRSGKLTKIAHPGYVFVPLVADN